MTRSQERRKLNERYLLLKEWYGKEYAKTEMAAHTSQPTDINLIIQHECECLAAGGRSSANSSPSTRNPPGCATASSALRCGTAR